MKVHWIDIVSVLHRAFGGIKIMCIMNKKKEHL